MRLDYRPPKSSPGRPCTLELGDSAESKFDWIRLGRISIRFTVVASLGAEAIYELWYVLSHVLAKLLTVISFGLAVNAQ